MLRPALAGQQAKPRTFTRQSAVGGRQQAIDSMQTPDSGTPTEWIPAFARMTSVSMGISISNDTSTLPLRGSPARLQKIKCHERQMEAWEWEKDKGEHKDMGNIVGLISRSARRILAPALRSADADLKVSATKCRSLPLCTRKRRG